MKVLDILFTTYNRLPFTKIVINNILQKGGYPVRFIFCDAGSTDGTQEYLYNRFKDANREHTFCFYEGEGKLLLSDNMNQGVNYIVSDLFMATQNDFIVGENNYLKTMVEVLRSSDYDVIRVPSWRTYNFNKESHISNVNNMPAFFRLHKTKKTLKALGDKFVGGRYESRHFNTHMTKLKCGFINDFIALNLADCVIGRGYVKGTDFSKVDKKVAEFMETGRLPEWPEHCFMGNKI